MMKKPKIPPREKKNSKYKIDEALRYAQKNENAYVEIFIKNKESYEMVLKYIEQKANIYELIKEDENHFKIDKTNSLVKIIYFYRSDWEDKNPGMFLMKELYSPKSYLIIDDEIDLMDKYNDYSNLKIERINFKKFKWAKIDKARLKELEENKAENT